MIARRLCWFLLAVVVAGCFPGPGEGYKVWVTNDSAEQIYVLFDGERSLADDDDPSTVSYLAGPGTHDIPGPFTYVDDTHVGAISLVDASCSLVERFDLHPGDFGVRIAADGTASLNEYGFGQRPTTTEQMAPSKECVRK